MTVNFTDSFKPIIDTCDPVFKYGKYYFTEWNKGLFLIMKNSYFLLFCLIIVGIVFGQLNKVLINKLKFEKHIITIKNKKYNILLELKSLTKFMIYARILMVYLGYLL